MVTSNTTTSEDLDSLYAILDRARSVEETRADLAGSGEGGRIASADSERFQRFESARKQSVKAGRGHCALADGSPRYADKPYTRERPREMSPELRAFYMEPNV